MNITHSEAYPAFLSRYAERSPYIAPLLLEFGAEALCQWIHGLGIDTFVGSSGRLFPTEIKAPPLLRPCPNRRPAAGVVIHTRHLWLGWNADGSLPPHHPEGERAVKANPPLLALGGAGWSPLGSAGPWLPLRHRPGVPAAPLHP
ncbi:aminoacetone oxidase family FAD-binding enzyme, partial [Pseudomonas sp. MWU12-2534b]